MWNGIEIVSDFYHAHPVIWTVGALLVGYVVGEHVVASAWEAQRRRLRKALGVASLEDYLHPD